MAEEGKAERLRPTVSMNSFENDARNRRKQMMQQAII